MKATYKIESGCLIVTAKLPSGKGKSECFILQNLMGQCTSFLELEFGFKDDDGQVYYFGL